MVQPVFRRRTTDQVYATLQQVQRRISEAGAGQPGPITASYGVKPMPPTPAVRPTPLPIPRTPLPADGGWSGPNPLASPAPIPLAPPMGGRNTLQLSASLAVTLAMLWIASCIAFYGAGSFFARKNNPSATTTTSTPTDDVGTATTAVIEKPKAKGFLLQLKSVPNWTPGDKKKWQDEVSKLNGIMNSNATRGWKPWFALREPSSGQLQLVFGKDGDTWGVDKDSWREFQKIMAAPTPNGGGYPASSWIPAE